MKVFLRIPTNESVHYTLVPWLAWIGRELPTADIDTQYTYGNGIAWGRNQMVRDFKASDCTHLWMIDSDTAPSANLHLLNTAEEHPVVCGPYNGFVEGWGVTWNVFRRREDNSLGYYPPAMWPQLDAPFRADAAGTGNMIIARGVFDALPEDPFRREDKGGNQFKSEDICFCEDVGGVIIEPRALRRHCRTVDLLESRNQLEARVQEEHNAVMAKFNGQPEGVGVKCP